MSGTFVPTGNQNPSIAAGEKPTQPKTLEAFTKLYAVALGATLEQLQMGEGSSVLEIMTSVPRCMRLRYLELRTQRIPHKNAIKIINFEWNRMKV